MNAPMRKRVHSRLFAAYCAKPMKIAAKSHDREGRASAEVGLLVQLKFRPDLARRGACSEIVALTYVALLVIIIGRRKNPVLMAAHCGRESLLARLTAWTSALRTAFRRWHSVAY